MGSRRNSSIDSTTTFSSPEILSPGGKSRYGRTRKPKITRDFCNIDDVEIVEDTSCLSPTKASIKSPEIVRDVVFEVTSEFTKLDDLEMKVANNFNMNLQRGVDASLKERKVFRSTPESALNMPNSLDVTKVLKIVSTKSSNQLELSKSKVLQKNTLKTYSNKKKHVHDSYIVESFGLPDEPIVPLISPIKVERNANIDVDIDKEVDVNLALSWPLDEFEPLYASEPIIRKPNLKGNNLFSKCNDTDFEKSRIPPETVEKINEKDQKKRGRKRLYKSISEDKIIKVDFTENEENSTLSPLTKKAKTETLQNKNVIQINTANKANMTKKSNVMSSPKAQNKLNSELRIVLNPVSSTVTASNPYKLKVNGAVEKVDDGKRSPVKCQSEVTEYKVGDLAWAKLGGHPYWPCIIIEDPQSKKHKKNFVHRCHTLYHVKFFGDNGRRSWVSATNIFPYNGPKDLAQKAVFHQNEGTKWSYINESFIVKPSKVPVWQIGVDEAESLVSKPFKDRLSYDFDSVKVKLKEARLSGKFQIKKEKKESIDPIKFDIQIKIEVEDEEIKTKRITRSSSITDDSCDDSCDLSVSLKSEFNESFTSTDSIKSKNKNRKFQKPEHFTKENLEARKKLRNSQIKPEIEKIKSQAKPEICTVKKKSETEATRQNKRQLQADTSNSDTDSKRSDNSSVPTSLASQAALFRRNNIFRGVAKDKVCQVCEEGGEVLKCRGPCNGVFHSECAIREAKEEEIGEKNGKKEDQVEIVTVNSKKPIPNLSGSPIMKGLSLAEKIDYRMKEIMKKEDNQVNYPESTDSSTEEVESPTKSKAKSKLTVTKSPVKKEVPIIKHVTADDISYVCVTDDQPIEDPSVFKCGWCIVNEAPPCLICKNEESKSGSTFRQKCSLHQCGRYYHAECLKAWPQTQWSVLTKGEEKDTFVCPRHVCHTCVSDDPRAAISRCSSDKVVKCLKCPATYHTSSHCVPAGTEILTVTQIVCPRHDSGKKKGVQTINTNWCFLCAEGGNLICCETCPTSVHVECLPGEFNEVDTFYCEDCQSGRLPLYDEIVWVKLGSFRWWPALILFPNEVPDNLNSIPHNRGEFVVKFFGTYDHYWVGRGRTFLFQEGDKGQSGSTKKRVDNAFDKAVREAAAAHLLKRQFKMNQANEKSMGLKPPPYVKIRVNKPVGNVRLFDGNTSNTTSCDCDPNDPHPCGPESDCLNRLLLTECNPEVCPAGNRCNNQCFEKREYPPLVPHRTFGRGWGLKTLAPIRKGQFVIEYVGEVIDEQEYQRRIKKMHEQQEENYYFLTIDKDRMLDAGPKGNVARFMNHSCQPNCETQKWTVNGDTRVGLFAKCDIPAETELTFNYNLECVGTDKKICRCDAPNCSGFIGVKVKSETGPKKVTKPRKKKSPPVLSVDNDDPCFVCGKIGNVGACNNKNCTKYYHLKCVDLEAWPEGGKWVCPWHSCDICTKRTIRCCYKCVNSFCPPHSHSNIRYDKKISAFVCFQHDKVEVPVVEDKKVKLNEIVTSTSIKKEEGTSIHKSKKGKMKKLQPKKKRDKNTADIDTILVSTRFLRSGAKFGSANNEV